MSKIINAIERYGLPVLSLASAIAAPLMVSAQLKPPAEGIPTVSGLGSLNGVAGWVATIGNWMFYFLILLAVIFVIIAAYRYLTAAGDPEKVKGANHTLMYAAIAVLVGVLARVMPELVGSIVGANANIVPTPN